MKNIYANNEPTNSESLNGFTNNSKSQKYKLSFSDILAKIQMCLKYKDIIKDYLEKVFDTLCMRLDGEGKKLSELNFNSYLDFPAVVGSKIFKAFDFDNDGYLDLAEFLSGMYNLYFGNLEVIQEITFKIFDIKVKGRIIKEDIIQIMKYLNSDDFLMEEVAEKVEEFFSLHVSINDMTFEEYCYILENEDSNFFFLFLIFIIKKQPFSEDSLRFFGNYNPIISGVKNYQFIFSYIKVNESKPISNDCSSQNKNLICAPNKDISFLFKYIFKPLEGVKRKFGKTNILDFSNFYNSSLPYEYDDTLFTEASPEGVNNLRHLSIDQPIILYSSNKDQSVYRLGTLKPGLRSHLNKDKNRENDVNINSNLSSSKKLTAVSTIGKLRKSITINMKEELFKNVKLEKDNNKGISNWNNNYNALAASTRFPILRQKSFFDGKTDISKKNSNGDINSNNFNPCSTDSLSNNELSAHYYGHSENQNKKYVTNSKLQNSSKKMKLPAIDAINSPKIANESLQSRRLKNDTDSSGDKILNFETMVYKFLPDNTLSKQKMVVVEKELYLFKFSFSKNDYTLDSVQSLSGAFITACDETTLLEKKFYPFALLSQFGNSMTHLNNLFFFRLKKDMEITVHYLKTLLGTREIKHDYEMVVSASSLGKGHFGKVKLAKNKKTEEEVAIKIIEKKKLKRSDFELIRSEIDILKLLKNSPHENTLTPIDFYEDKNNIYIVTEYLKGGTLADYLVDMQNVITEKESKFICKQVAAGIKHLRLLGIIHRDIKTENILVVYDKKEIANFDYNYHKVKLIDFGLSKCLCKSEKTQEGFGTLIFTAPEVLFRKPYDHKIDIWSFGILVYYINSGKFPFDGSDSNLDEIGKKIVSEPVCFLECNFSPELKTLVQGCLEKKPSHRLCIDRVLASDWIST